MKCMTKNGSQLARIAIVDMNGTVLYDKLVKPESEIIDYLTKFVIIILMIINTY